MRTIFREKFGCGKKAWEDLNITIVAPSRWISNCAKRSSLFQNNIIEQFPNGADIQLYYPINQRDARKKLSLNSDKKIILFGAMNKSTSDPNKGFQLLQRFLLALNNYACKTDVEIVIFGCSTSSHFINYGFKTHYFGLVHDDITLDLCYIQQVFDVFVVPIDVRKSS